MTWFDGVLERDWLKSRRLAVTQKTTVTSASGLKKPKTMNQTIGAKRARDADSGAHARSSWEDEADLYNMLYKMNSGRNLTHAEREVMSNPLKRLITVLQTASPSDTVAINQRLTKSGTSDPANLLFELSTRLSELTSSTKTTSSINKVVSVMSLDRVTAGDARKRVVNAMTGRPWQSATGDSYNAVLCPAAMYYPAENRYGEGLLIGIVVDSKPWCSEQDNMSLKDWAVIQLPQDDEHPHEAVVNSNHKILGISDEDFVEALKYTAYPADRSYISVVREQSVTIHSDSWSLALAACVKGLPFAAYTGHAGLKHDSSYQILHLEEKLRVSDKFKVHLFAIASQVPGVMIDQFYAAAYVLVNRGPFTAENRQSYFPCVVPDFYGMLAAAFAMTNLAVDKAALLAKTGENAQLKPPVIDVSSLDGAAAVIDDKILDANYNAQATRMMRTLETLLGDIENYDAHAMKHKNTVEIRKRTLEDRVARLASEVAALKATRKAAVPPQVPKLLAEAEDIAEAIPMMTNLTTGHKSNYLVQVRSLERKLQNPHISAQMIDKIASALSDLRSTLKLGTAIAESTPDDDLLDY